MILTLFSLVKVYLVQSLLRSLVGFFPTKLLFSLEKTWVFCTSKGTHSVLSITKQLELRHTEQLVWHKKENTRMVVTMETQPDVHCPVCPHFASLCLYCSLVRPSLPHIPFGHRLKIRFP